MTTPTVAANAYATLARLHDPTATAKSATETPGTGGFGDMLKNAIGALNQTARASDFRPDSTTLPTASLSMEPKLWLGSAAPALALPAASVRRESAV